jgi:sulfatase maturation enzyme AslB (radical SAM superfamily)
MIEEGKTDTIVSLTYTVTRENYKRISEFLEMYEERWPLFYTVFFSSYKGCNERFALNEEEIEDMFKNVAPQIDEITDRYGDEEMKKLFHASHERRTFKQVIRFPKVKVIPCYLQLSELVVDEDGDISNCSHLFRVNAPKTGLNLRDGHLKELF